MAITSLAVHHGAWAGGARNGVAQRHGLAAVAGSLGGEEREMGSGPLDQNRLAGWDVRGRKEAREDWAAKRVLAQESGGKMKFVSYFLISF
jgi:hypothetical protein